MSLSLLGMDSFPRAPVSDHPGTGAAWDSEGVGTTFHRSWCAVRDLQGEGHCHSCSAK